MAPSVKPIQLLRKGAVGPHAWSVAWTFTVTATGTLPLVYQWQRDTGDLVYHDLVDCTNTSLVLPNVQASDAANYRAIVTNLDGAVTSAVTHLSVLVPPWIKSTTWLQHQVARIGTHASFAVGASGTPPLAYQWRLDAQELPFQTNSTLRFSAVQPADEGDYTVVVTNLAGAVTSAPARLWVVPPTSGNNLGRLPYCYILPSDYDAARCYPLWLSFHGTTGDETVFFSFVTNSPGYMTMTAHGWQSPDQAIQLLPTRRAGDESWTDAYLRQVSALLDDFLNRFSVDTNRIYAEGGSEGLHAAWDMIAMRPGFFAGACLQAGWPGTRPAAAVKDVPVWAWCARDDAADQWGNTQRVVRNLRVAGGNVRYTEYATGVYTDNPERLMIRTAPASALATALRSSTIGFSRNDAARLRPGSHC